MTTRFGGIVGCVVGFGNHGRAPLLIADRITPQLALALFPRPAVASHF